MYIANVDGRLSWNAKANAGLAAYGSAENATLLLDVVIVGTGGLGLMAIQLAKAITDLTDKMVADAVIDFINTYKSVEIDMQFLDEEQG